MSNLNINELNTELTDIKRFLREDTRTIIANEIKSNAANTKSTSNEVSISYLRKYIDDLKDLNNINKQLIENVLDREARIIRILGEILK
jgi:hypothetical protein